MARKSHLNMRFTTKLVREANVLIKSGYSRSAAYKAVISAEKSREFEQKMNSAKGRVFTIQFLKKGTGTLETRDVVSLQSALEMGLWQDKETGRKIPPHCLGFFDMSPEHDAEGNIIGTKGVRMCIRTNFIGELQR
jgi:hypothetical protein